MVASGLLPSTTPTAHADADDIFTIVAAALVNHAYFTKPKLTITRILKKRRWKYCSEHPPCMQFMPKRLDNDVLPSPHKSTEIRVPIKSISSPKYAKINLYFKASLRGSIATMCLRTIIALSATRGIRSGGCRGWALRVSVRPVCHHCACLVLAVPLVWPSRKLEGLVIDCCTATKTSKRSS